MASTDDDSVLFYLKGYNKEGIEVVNDPNNQYLASTADGHVVLAIGYNMRSPTNTNTLATMGRDGDILVNDRLISRIQCSFEIEPKTGVVLLYDRSTSRSTQVYGDPSFKFELNGIRRVVVQKDMNQLLGMGGTGRNRIQFEIVWKHSPSVAMGKLRGYSDTLKRRENPRHARTIVNPNNEETVVNTPLPMMTRTHTLGQGQSQFAYVDIGRIGAGAFGEVRKIVNVYSGELFAQKKLRPLCGNPSEEERRKRHWSYLYMKREVEVLSQMRHVSDILAGYIHILSALLLILNSQT